jgi:thiol-disulfide isomerase/thioredoxin
MRALLLIVLAAAACGTERPRGVEIVAAPEGDVPTIVKRELERAGKDRRQLLVYVGATWCEPCRRFHEAAKEHRLDGAFPQLRLLEFDNDRDGARLAMAGYTSQFIPLFARPGTDGRGVGRQIEGSVKGDGAVEQIVPRLRGLLTP